VVAAGQVLKKKHMLVGTSYKYTNVIFQRIKGVELPRTAGRKMQFLAPPTTQRDKTDDVVLSVQCISLDALGVAVRSFKSTERGTVVLMFAWKNNLAGMFFT